MDRITINEASQQSWRADGAENKRYDYDIGPDDVVIDIGAYLGEFATRLLRSHPCRLIAVEPTDAILGFEGAEQIINMAASTHNGHEKYGGSFLYTSFFEQTARRSFACFDINSLLLRFNEIALCKINIEGGEYRILPHIIRAGLHRRIANLQVQFHQIEGQPYRQWYADIVKTLKKTHLTTYLYPFCWENWERK